MRPVDERFERLMAALMELPRVKVLEVVRVLHDIKMRRRQEGLRYPEPKNCSLVWPPSPPVEPSTYTPRPPYRRFRLIRGGRP
jgi:hypothetical protein